MVTSARAVTVMGVAGSGKTTIARALAERCEWVFVDADDLHPPENVAKMRAGRPLTDDDRWPWLNRVVARIDEETAARGSVVVACSALRRSYRDALRKTSAAMIFCHVEVPEAVLVERLALRTGHFMPPALLRSQLATLEALDADEPGGTVSGLGDQAAVLGRITRFVQGSFDGARPDTGSDGT